MAVSWYFDIQSLAYRAGWEVEPKSLGDGRLLLSSALHKYECYVERVENELYLLTFSSNSLITELKTRFKELIQFPIKNRDLIHDVLRTASVLAKSLPDSPLVEFEEKIKNITADKTTVIREVEQRIGQDIFRKHLLKYWGDRCAITYIGVPQLLVASHSKPWKDCISGEERLNIFNGFLLEARYDRLFDQGLITFSDNGSVIVSNFIDTLTKNVLGLDTNLKLRWVREEHLPFLHWHQQRVFQK